MLDIKDELMDQMVQQRLESGSDSEESAAAKGDPDRLHSKEEWAEIEKIINDPSRLISTRELIYKMKK